MQGWGWFIGFLGGQLVFQYVMRWIEADESQRFPELAAIEDEPRRAAIWGAAKDCSHRSVLFGAILIAWMLPGIFLIEPQLPSWLRGQSPGAFAAVFSYLAAGALIASAIAIRISRQRMERVIRVRISAAGVPLCLDCGYQVRGLPEPRCPECGGEIRTGICPECAGDGRIGRRGLVMGLGVVLLLLGIPCLSGVTRRMGGWTPEGKLIGVASVALAVILTAYGLIMLSRWTRPCEECGGSGEQRELPELPKRMQNAE